ncbi:MAG: class I SAM-dependent methyltransferase [bacterium]
MSESPADPTKRFSDRVENYVKYRPRYPREVLDALRTECGLTPSSVIADVGSGTGILTEMLLANGNVVFAVEPNADMREAAERSLAGRSSFRSVAGRAEATTLGDSSVDIVTAGQAFHWFERDAARREFIRILRPGGWVALVWNEREADATPFLVAYEELLRRHSPDYLAVDHRQIDEEVLDAFFGAGGYRSKAFRNRQDFDYEGLEGRLLSSSYAPMPGHPNHAPMLKDLAAMFRTHARDGRVTFEYRTILFYGRLAKAGADERPRR